MAAEIDSCIKKDFENFISLSYALNGSIENSDQVFETLDLYL